MPVNIRIPDAQLGDKDLDDEYITDAWLVDQYVGNVMFSWGANVPYGSLGLNDTNNRSSPVQVGSLTSWKQVEASPGQFFHAIKTDGTLWGCGYNAFKQLGDGTATNRSSPVQVGISTNWKQVSSTQFTGFAVTNTGTLWVWGEAGAYSELFGIGVSGFNLAIGVTQIGTDTKWKQVSAQGIILQFSSIIASKTDGTLWTWGLNDRGQLGHGDTANRSVPVQVGSLTTWSKISSGGLWNAAIKTDGTLWTWGSNNLGQLGIGNTVYYSSPVQVGSLTNWRQIFCGPTSAAAIKTDGTLWTWGINDRGQLGIGNTVYYSSPVQVGSLTNWKQISIRNESNFFAIKTDGTLWFCGYGGAQGVAGLGLSTAVYYSSPVQVGSLTNWKTVSTVGSFALGITYREI